MTESDDRPTDREPHEPEPDSAPAPGTESLSARLRRAGHDLRPLDLGEQTGLIVHLLRWITLGSVSGVLAGVSSAVFLKALDWATRTRLEHGWLLWLLPVAGFVMGYAYWKLAGRAAEGNALIIDEIHDPQAWVPRRMAPLILFATIGTHLFGGSAGREGTAIQMSGSLTDWFSRVAELGPGDRRILLIAAISGGFGATFGVPVAGAVFGLEVQSIGRMRYEAIVPALAASIVGDLVARGLGIHHATVEVLGVPSGPVFLAKVAVAGLAFGLAGALFIETTHAIKKLVEALLVWPPLRPVLGGVVIIGLVLVVGNRDYLGLSAPIAAEALIGIEMGLGVFALKLLFTAVTLGTGYQGGEVTPLFVMGAALGATLGHWLGVPTSVLAAVGFVAVFAGASNTPLACTVMGIELFGPAVAVPMAIGCVVSYVFSSHRSIYGSQRIEIAKGEVGFAPGTSMRDVSRHVLPRRRWYRPTWWDGGRSGE